jgi:hypothetical protein
MINLINLSADSTINVEFFINKWILLGLATLIIIYILNNIKYNFKSKRKYFEIEGAEIGSRESKIKIKPNYEDAQIAYKLWAELSTRKIGLPIDFENDVIDEIYNSWYEFFKITRELVKNIPVNKIRKNESTQKLVYIAIDVLNVGIRPHLTLWQARFRKWYHAELLKEENCSLSPQEIQKRFPDFERLVADMKSVNQKLIKYRDVLEDLALE